MKKMTSTTKTGKKPATGGTPSAGTQTLLRGLDVLEAVLDGPIDIAEIASRIDLTRSTAHRLASALVDRRYLSFVPREGYRLGPKLLELGYRAREQVDITRVIHPFLEALSQQTGHTLHLGILEGRNALYLDKVTGRRRVEISSRVGEMHPLTSTGLGKALILDMDEATWRELWVNENPNAGKSSGFTAWIERMRKYKESGCTFDLEENEDHVRCVGAPIRNSSGRIVAAISLSSVIQYMSDARMRDIAKLVLSSSQEASRQLGWVPN